MLELQATVDALEIGKALHRAEGVLRWVATSLDGLKIPTLPTEKRVQLAAACCHVAIEHGQAIAVLVEEKLYGSSLRMVRPLFEAYVRGMWVLHAASDAEVDGAGADRFPSFGHMVSSLEKPGLFEDGVLSGLKKEWWSGLCSFTHTGYQQIGARLTPSGLDYGYQKSEILNALTWADFIQMLCLIQFAQLAGNETLALSALDRLRSVGHGVTNDREARNWQGKGVGSR